MIETEIPLNQIHICGSSIYCDYEGCELNNIIERVCLSNGEINEDLIGLDEELNINDDFIKIDIDYRVEYPTNFTIDIKNKKITLRYLLNLIYSFLLINAEIVI